MTPLQSILKSLGLSEKDLSPEQLKQLEGSITSGDRKLAESILSEALINKGIDPATGEPMKESQKAPEGGAPEGGNLEEEAPEPSQAVITALETVGLSAEDLTPEQLEELETAISSGDRAGVSAILS